MDFIPVAKPKLGNLESYYVNCCLQTTWISSTGEYIQKFEQAFADYFQVPYAISCSNGTTALHLALVSLGIGPGDEVILPALSFVATANVIKYVGATPVFVDIDKDTWNINPLLIEKAITKKTRAVMPVHLYGYPTDMKFIMYLAHKYHIYVIEDAAEAHGAKYYGKYVGTYGDIGCFSFYGNKIITTGEGGMLITRNKDLADRIRLLKNHGMSENRKYYHPVIGFNYRMTNIQAAIGLAQLSRIDYFIRIREKINQAHRQNLKELPLIKLQTVNKNLYTVCWIFSCLIKSKTKTRDRLMKYLKQKHIDSRPFFLPLTTFPMYKNENRFPVAEEVSRQGINIPTFVGLTQSQIRYVTDSVKAFFDLKINL